MRNSISYQELKRILYVMQELYKEHPNDYDLYILNKIKDILKGGQTDYGENRKKIQ